MGVQPEAIKVPVQMHGGQEDSMKGLSDPEVRPSHWQTRTYGSSDILCSRRTVAPGCAAWCE